jgi:hypothetical protein
LGFPSSPRCRDEERILRVHLLRGAVVRHHGGGFVVIDVAARHHVHGRARAAHDDHVIDAADAVDRGIHVRLQRHLAAAAQALVRGDHARGLRVLDAARERVGREAAEHHGMHGAEPRAGEHRVSGFRDHRQVDRHAVAALHAAVAQHVRHAAHIRVQLAIGDRLRLGGVVALPDDRDLIAAGGEVPVDAIVGHVGGAVLEPADRHGAGAEIHILHAAVGLKPVDALALLVPEGVRVAQARLVHLAVAGLVRIGAAAPLGRDVVDLVFHWPSSRNARAGKVPGARANCLWFYGSFPPAARRGRSDFRCREGNAKGPSDRGGRGACCRARFHAGRRD